MATQTNTTQRHMEYESQGFGSQVPFESLNECGTYVCNWSGHLLRVPDDAIKPGRSPLMTIIGAEPLFLTKISNDPFIVLSKARILAANCDVHVNF